MDWIGRLWNWLTLSCKSRLIFTHSMLGRSIIFRSRYILSGLYRWLEYIKSCFEYCKKNKIRVWHLIFSNFRPIFSSYYGKYGNFLLHFVLQIPLHPGRLSLVQWIHLSFHKSSILFQMYPFLITPLSTNLHLKLFVIINNIRFKNT